MSLFEIRGRFDEAQQDALDLADRMADLVEVDREVDPELARVTVNYKQQRIMMRRLRALAREEGSW